jgi:hypothetical protein
LSRNYKIVRREVRVALQSQSQHHRRYVAMQLI